MQIRQFEKLKTLVKEAVDQLLKTKLENKTLLQQNEELRKKLEKASNSSDVQLAGEVKRLREENKTLLEKQQMVSARLNRVLARVKNLGEGVES